MKAKQPNILLIMADQLVPTMTGAYGSTVAHTPNIDKLAREGVRFDTAYASCPICAPARMSLLTGKYVSEINANDNTSILPSDEPTHNHYLTIGGYDTVISGKLHSIGPDQLHGFAKRLNTDVYPADFNWLALCREEVKDFSKAHIKPIALDYIGEGAGVRQWSMTLDYDEDTVHKALEYIRGKRSKPSGTLQKPLPERDNTPFFLQVSFQHPHEPFLCLQRHWDLYEGVDIPIPEYPDNLEGTFTSMDRDLNKCHGSVIRNDQKDTGKSQNGDKFSDPARLLRDPESLKKVHRAYYASISYVDEKVGQLLDELQESGLADDTIVIITSDHGDMLCHKGMIQKRTFYDQASKIALIFTFPKNFPIGKAGTVCKDPASTVDICPTLLELAGVKEHLPMDGRSLLHQLRGESDTERYIFVEHHSEGVRGTCFMVRKGKYKYNYIYQRESQLFDMDSDPGEWNNLSGKSEYRGIEAELKALILKRFDPDKINKELEENIAKRWVLKRAHDILGGPNWAYQPFVDANNQYWRKG